ncbi:metal-dependent transcriptional regulator [Haploplasma modicum]|jgi:DtxR family transcriptional regulator, Mn-dependent transcriptional regulator|uniref:metal-dependent transcriptional regulator n=1 Tax=Haploplasma modicum TaxID=2150 RepID=UPI00214BBD57|nr:metal-dependent transcriptional regulator [Haploplasma modicum]MCR1808593.1 metal-dependent transcriptional regulator [Haploplasma modicum]
MINRSEEDYLKTIYDLKSYKNESIIKSLDIAESLGFTDQSVNEMIKKLSKKGYLNYIPYKGVELTDLGTKEAIRMVRAHRIWEVFLMNELKYSWDQVHEEAELLEHTANPELIEKLYIYLGKPEYCGHGNPIPNLEGKIAQAYTKRLIDFEVSEVFTLKRVLDNKELLLFLSNNNITLNSSFIVKSKDLFSGIIKIENKKSEVIITNKIAKMLFGI